MLTVTNLAGAPYHYGDPIVIAGHECNLVEIERIPSPQPFGRHWAIIAARCTDGAWLRAQVDDNGYNKTGKLVGPSDRIVA